MRVRICMCAAECAASCRSSHCRQSTKWHTHSPTCVSPLPLPPCCCVSCCQCCWPRHWGEAPQQLALLQPPHQQSHTDLVAGACSKRGTVACRVQKEGKASQCFIVSVSTEAAWTAAAASLTESQQSQQQLPAVEAHQGSRGTQPYTCGQYATDDGPALQGLPAGPEAALLQQHLPSVAPHIMISTA
jgi:hypothetical protein